MAAAKHCPGSPIYTLKPALGESVGASGMWQIVCAAEALVNGALPPLLNAPSAMSRGPREFTRAIVSVCGLNQQVAGLRLALTR
jgi:3-oxoacyl-(acyl-carrier-protein) synthase